MKVETIKTFKLISKKRVRQSNLSASALSFLNMCCHQRSNSERVKRYLITRNVRDLSCGCSTLSMKSALLVVDFRENLRSLILMRKPSKQNISKGVTLKNFLLSIQMGHINLQDGIFVDLKDYWRSLNCKQWKLCEYDVSKTIS